MGPGIADEFARSGRRAFLMEPGAERLEAALGRVRDAHDVLREAGCITAEDAAKAVGLVQGTTSLEEACIDADLVIEAVTEDMHVKNALFRQIDTLAPDRALLATNTSGLSVTQIARATGRPERVCGLHFFNPAYVVPLVEVVQGEATSEETAAGVYDLCTGIGKQPVRVRRDVPGFVANRLQFAVFREAVHLLEEGVATAEDIDRALQAGPGFRYSFMGQLKTADLAGLDVFLAISSYLFADLSGATSPPEGLKQMVAEGKTGVKSGAGYYDYANGAGDRLVMERDRLLLRVRRVLEAARKA